MDSWPNQHPAICRQTLNLRQNDWFGVSGGRQVELLWVYNNRVRDWYQLLSSEVQQLLGDFDDPDSFHGFPDYSTINTDLTATEINLLTSLSAWVVAGSDVARRFVEMYSE